ncbi:hypothetical protein [Corynebacterium diphtheriae]|nr:hypothetical protein [Corynebacterium diphtheriae]
MQNLYVEYVQKKRNDREVKEARKKRASFTLLRGELATEATN